MSIEIEFNACSPVSTRRLAAYPGHIVRILSLLHAEISRKGD